MKKNKVDVIYPVLDRDLSEIEQWSYDKQNVLINGILHNHWYLIKERFDKKNMIALKVNNQLVGFITWIYELGKSFQRIEYMIVKDSEQNKGYGQVLAKACLDIFATNGTKVVTLSPIKHSNQACFFWKSVGFQGYPKYFDSYGDLYRILVESPQTITITRDKEVIEIWDCYGADLENDIPDKIWEIQYMPNSNSLQYPIALLCDGLAKIRWRYNDYIYEQCLVKKFQELEELFPYSGEILVIDSLRKKLENL